MTADRATCRSCGAPIVWAESSRGNLMPVDARPVAGGNIDLSDDVSVRSTPRAEIVPADPTAVRYTSHFVTCPDADKHRRR